MAPHLQESSKAPSEEEVLRGGVSMRSHPSGAGGGSSGWRRDRGARGGGADAVAGVGGWDRQTFRGVERTGSGDSACLNHRGICLRKFPIK